MHSIPEAAKLLNISTRTVYARLRAGELVARKIGGCTRIEDAELVRYKAALPRAMFKPLPANAAESVVDPDLCP